jgi:hypothetical protein
MFLSSTVEIYLRITSYNATENLNNCVECDIRSCLNTLQFLNKKKQPLSIVSYFLWIAILLLILQLMLLCIHEPLNLCFVHVCMLVLLFFLFLLSTVHSGWCWFSSHWLQGRVKKCYRYLERGITQLQVCMLEISGLFLCDYIPENAFLRYSIRKSQSVCVTLWVAKLDKLMIQHSTCTHLYPAGKMFHA